MPLVVVSGQPASGKSGVCAALAGLLQAQGQRVLVVDEPGLHLQRNTAYQTSTAEKATRGALKSAVERAVCRKTTVILDSLNNIKGYRYELWCVARAAGTRYCVLHVATPADTCAAWNGQRPEGERYSDAVFRDLAGRFETPDARNRWDAPLFTLTPGQPDEATVLAAVAAAMAGSSQQQQQQQQQAQASQQPSAADGAEEQTQRLMHQGVSVGELAPTYATSNPVLLGTNVLHEIDRATQDVLNRVVEAQQLAAAGGGCMQLDLGDAGRLRVTRPVSLAELRRHKRSFLRLATKITFSRLSDAAAAQRLFVDFLNQQLGGSGG